MKFHSELRKDPVLEHTPDGKYVVQTSNEEK
jgi:hypothetical protein